MNDTAALVSLATSVPPHQFHQEQILRPRAICSRIATRSSRRFRACLPTPASAIATASNRSNGISSGAAGRSAHRLFWKARKPCLSTSRAKPLARADLAADDIDTVVTVCSTGIATPTLEARVAGKLGLRSRRVARAGLRPGLRGRRVRPVDRVAARAGAARHQRAAGRARTLHACRPPRRIDQGQYRRRQPVRRWRRGGHSARRRRRRDPDRGVRAKSCGPTRSISWAGASIPKASASSSSARFPISSPSISAPR